MLFIHLLRRLTVKCNQLRYGKAFNLHELKAFSSHPKSDSNQNKVIKDFILNKKDSAVNEPELKKPVLIYSNENTTYYRRLFVLNVCQLCFWWYFANEGMSLFLKKPNKSADKGLNEDKAEDKPSEPFLTRLAGLWSENWKQMSLILTALTIGQLSAALIMMFTMRSVRYLILSPGGQSVRLTTFSVTGSPNRYRSYDIPLDQISAAQHRNFGGNYIPLKVKNRWFHFLVDTKGQFFKPTLFDQTVGVFRILK